LESEALTHFLRFGALPKIKNRVGTGEEKVAGTGPAKWCKTLLLGDSLSPANKVMLSILPPESMVRTDTD
jgi:hypothetical protein